MFAVLKPLKMNASYANKESIKNNFAAGGNTMGTFAI